MRIVEQFANRVRELENVWITLADGTRLAARIWLPEGAPPRRVPAILEYLPYRKRDGTAERDALTHPYFAGNGYAAVRVDMRGSGESDGLLRDEYLKQEQDDALEVIAWIAAQPWCSGAVGMIGISWGGFNGLQVAARRPPALGAVVSICSTDDRYADDIHYMGGCLLDENLGWASTMLAYMSRPPDPALVGERWRAMWLHRLENQPFLLETWLAHQRRDAYWAHASVCEDFAAIACPVLAVGGWADGYSNAVPRLLAGLNVPRQGLIGPWAHKYPHFAKPGPRIGFLQYALRWFDEHLAGHGGGVMNAPMYRVWMQQWQEPRAQYEERSGRWVAEPAWPSPRITQEAWALNPDGLGLTAGAERRLDWSSPQDLGEAAGAWLSFGLGPDQPTDQLADDGRALVFDSPPLAERLEILGAPSVELDVVVDRPQALLCARLEEVAPAGGALRVSFGVLNLTHRNGHQRPEPLIPGQRYRVRLVLNDAAHSFAPGHRLRLALSTTYWPIVWPSPEPVTLGLFSGRSRLLLPVRPPRPEDAALAVFPPAEGAPPLLRTWQRLEAGRRTVTRDAATGETVLEVLSDTGRSTIMPIGLEVEMIQREAYRIRPRDPLSARVDIHYTTGVGRGAWQTRTEARTAMRATEDAFLIEATLDAYEGATRVFARNWQARIPRDGV